jgi:cell division FtsZ-interacting protein ZapD
MATAVAKKHTTIRTFLRIEFLLQALLVFRILE